MSGQDITDKILGELDSINWSGNDTSMYRMLTMQAISKGIQSYINSNWSITATTIGVLTNPPPAPPVPLADKLDVTLMVGQAPILQGMLMTMTMMAQNILPFFSGLAAWLSAPPWTVTITKGTVLTVVTGMGIATFPSMTAMGAACLGEMSASKPDTKEKAWKIMGKHIYNGLAANLIPPIPTVGSLPPGAYSGVTTCIMKF